MSSLFQKPVFVALMISAIIGAAVIVLLARPEQDASSLENQTTSQVAPSLDFLVRQFPSTDWSKIEIETDSVVSGGPARDGIPAIDEPKFEELTDSSLNKSGQALVYVGQQEVRVYPYAILYHHEIVNDTVEGKPIAVTFCPLCGTAIVFNRETSAGTSEFGVSGALSESNMLMYDRKTESFWQQSTGKSVIGSLSGEELELEPFQLLTLQEASELYPEARILSTNTGYSRDYSRSPYGDYEQNQQFIFRPSSIDARFAEKEIFVVANVEGVSLAIPWLQLLDDQTYRYKTINGTEITLTKQDGELDINYLDGRRIPHYFEMWFSWAVQHKDDPQAEIYQPQEEQS